MSILETGSRHVYLKGEMIPSAVRSQIEMDILHVTLIFAGQYEKLFTSLS